MPSPFATLITLGTMVSEKTFWVHLIITLFRGALALAEFLGADRGIGARIYWAYRMMESVWGMGNSSLIVNYPSAEDRGA